MNPGAKPASIDFEHAEGGLKGKAWKGIYTFDGDIGYARFLYAVRAHPMTHPVSPKAALECPVCGAPNDCAPARTGTFDTPCWCASVTIDPAAVVALPEALRGKACLCPRCAAAAAER